MSTRRMVVWGILGVLAAGCASQETEIPPQVKAENHYNVGVAQL